MSEWISIEDQNPSALGYIVCLINEMPFIGYVDDGNLYVMKNAVFFDLPSRKWIIDPLFGKITHWMPIPDFPKPKNQKYEDK